MSDRLEPVILRDLKRKAADKAGPNLALAALLADHPDDQIEILEGCLVALTGLVVGAHLTHPRNAGRDPDVVAKEALEQLAARVTKPMPPVPSDVGRRVAMVRKMVHG